MFEALGKRVSRHPAEIADRRPDKSIIRRLWIVLVASLVLSTPVAAQKRIALTFDDAPRPTGAFFTPTDRRIALIAALKKAKVRQAAFFVNPGKLTGGDDDRIMAYARAGHVIANHSFSHSGLSNSSVDAYLVDIDKAAVWLKGRKGYRPWFRFPYLDEGRRDKVKRDAVREGLCTRGLRNGYVTVESSDWHIEDLMIAAKRDAKALDMDALRDLYVSWHVEAAKFYDDLAIKAIGRSPAHVMLLHENDIAALYVGDLVKALRKDGWTIISADEAYADPLSREMPDTPSAQGDLIEMIAWEKRFPAPRWYKYNDTDLATGQFNAKVVREAAK